MRAKAGRFVAASAVGLIWAPAVALTLVSNNQFAQKSILLPYARSMGLSHSSELSASQFYYVFTKTVLTAGVLLPVASLALSLFFGARLAAKATLGCALALTVLSYVNLVGVANTGNLMTWDLLVDAAITLNKDADLAAQYVSMSSLGKLAIFLIATYLLYLGAVSTDKILRFAGARAAVVGGMSAILLLPLLAVSFLHFSERTDVDPRVDFVRQQVGTLFAMESGSVGPFAGLGLDDAVALFQEHVNAPRQEFQSPFFATEKDSNVIIVSFESGPHAVVDFERDPDFRNLRLIAQQAFVANQHFTTYPYTSDALFSLFGSLYPNRLRREILADSSAGASMPIHGNRLGVFNALRRNGYVVNVYLPEESLFESDSSMFSLFGAHDILVADANDQTEQRWVDAIEETTSSIPGYENVRADEREAFETQLGNDLVSFDKVLDDLRKFAERDEKFAIVYLPLVGHAPWPSLEPSRSLLETGKDIFLIQDRWLGQIYELLEELEILDSTIVVVTADHGLRTAAEYPFLAPGTLNDISFRVPLVIRAPKALQRPVVIDHVTSHIDFAPTLLSLLGIESSAMHAIGSPVWDEQIGGRRTFFLADAYLGIDGYHETGTFVAYQRMTNTATNGTSMVSHEVANGGVSLSSLAYLSGEPKEDVRTTLAIQESFQRYLQRELMRND